MDVKGLQLLQDGAKVPTEPQVFALLRHLVENRDRVVSRDEIFEVIWKGRIVSDAAISSRIKAVRAAIGDDGGRQALIRTVHGLGFQFIGELDHGTAPANAPNVAARPSLGILPTLMMTPTDDQRMFGEGLEDDISAAIGRVGTIYVARQTGPSDPKTASEQLGVRYILSLKLRFSGNAFRLNASLLNGARSEEVWADRFDGQLDDPFTAQDQVVAAVLGRLVPNIMMVEVQRAASESGITDAYHELLRATPLCMSMDANSNRQAVIHLERALEAEPGHSLSRAMLSWCLGQQALSEWAPDKSAAFAAAMRHGQQALTEAPLDALVLTFVASAEVASGEHIAARHHLETALDLDPSLAWAWAMLGALETYWGNLQNAIENYERALRLSPHDPMRFSYYFGIGAAKYGTGNYVEALPMLEQGYIEAPGSTWAPRLIMATAAELGHETRMKEMAKVVRALTPNSNAEQLMDSAPIRDPGYRELLTSSFRKAGF